MDGVVLSEKNLGKDDDKNDKKKKKKKKKKDDDKNDKKKKKKKSLGTSVTGSLDLSTALLYPDVRIGSLRPFSINGGGASMLSS